MGGYVPSEEEKASDTVVLMITGIRMPDLLSESTYVRLMLDDKMVMDQEFRSPQRAILAILRQVKLWLNGHATRAVGA